MIKKYLHLLISIMVTGAIIFTPLLASALSNISNETKAAVCAGVQLDDPAACDATSGDSRINTITSTVVNILSFIVGLAAVIMIILGGFKYITSGGDSNKTSSAQQTIIYAIVGLIIVALAQIIVRFVLKKTV